MSSFEVPPGYTIGLLATMPRSGTWYSFYVLEFLEAFLSGKTEISTRMNLEVYETLRLAKASVHSICPGFLEHYRGPRREAWDALSFYVPTFNYGYEKFIEGNQRIFSPLLNPKIRIVYIFRNPLDQAVSYFRHAQHSRHADRMTRIGTEGQEMEITDPKEHFVRVGLEAYIKQYFTFHIMRQGFARNVLKVPYENLVRDPAGQFSKILAFWGFTIDTAEKRDCLERALNAAAPESLKVVEQALQSSLGRDQLEPGESHMRGGEISKWRDHLGPDELKFARRRLAVFDLTLEDFILE